VFTAQWEPQHSAKPNRLTENKNIPGLFSNRPQVHFIQSFFSTDIMKHLTLFSFSCFLFLIGIPLCGCGTSGIPVIKATGKVKYNGEPLADATVSFVATGEGGRGASGMTLQDGTFQVVTQGAVKGGCIPGSYKIKITKMIAVDAGGKPIIGEYHGTEMPQIKTVIPQKYSDADRSGFTAEVIKGGKNHFVFELKD
jgi:hypothetical protein